MKKYEIYLPLKYNDGTEIEASRDVVTVFEAHKDPMNLRDKKDISGGRHKKRKGNLSGGRGKNPKSRCFVRKNHHSDAALKWQEACAI
jgi:hypothetical protein